MLERKFPFLLALLLAAPAVACAPEGADLASSASAIAVVTADHLPALNTPVLRGDGAADAGARAFRLVVDSASACAFVQDGDATSSDFPFPSAGTKITFTNTSTEAVLIDLFVVVEKVLLPGQQDSWFYPEMGAELDVADTSIVPANLVGQVVKVAPGKTVTAVMPPIQRSRELDTEARFGCKSVAEFAVRPKFSYGARLHFLSSAP